MGSHRSTFFGGNINLVFCEVKCNDLTDILKLDNRGMVGKTVSETLKTPFFRPEKTNSKASSISKGIVMTEIAKDTCQLGQIAGMSRT